MIPPAVLAQQLAEARRRGELFEQAFPVALAAALAGEPGREQRAWEAVLMDHADVWRGAYERHGPADRSGLALRRLEEPDAVPLPKPQVQVEA